jgi:phosphatidylglycerol:prolipoprotein diacylglycerol transferase
VIPYLEHPVLDLGFYRLEAFRVLVLLAIVTQFVIVVRRAPRFGIASDDATRWIVWAVGCGLFGAHAFDAVAYYPETVRENPLELLRFWGNLSSTGGMLFGLAGLVGVMAYQRVDRARMVAFVDLTLFALPFTLAVGRLGCGLQHDHLGVASTSPLAVAFPDGPRFDLGLLEFFVCTLIAALFLWLARRPRPSGFYAALFFVLYAPARFGLDALRTGDARYLGLTPAQYLCIGAGLLAVAALFLVRKNPPPPSLVSEAA